MTDVSSHQAAARRELLQMLPAGLLLGVTLFANFELWKIATVAAVIAAAGICAVAGAALVHGVKAALGKFFARHGVSARVRALCAEGAFIGLIVVVLLAQLVEFQPTADRGAALPILVAGLAAWVVFVAVLVGGAAVAARRQRRRRLHRNAPRAGTQGRAQMIYPRNEFNDGVAALAGFLAGSVVGGILMMAAILYARTNDLVGPESPRWMIALLVPALAITLVGGCTWLFYQLFLRLQRRMELR